MSAAKNFRAGISAGLISYEVGDLLFNYLKEDYMRGALITLNLDLSLSKRSIPRVEFFFSFTSRE